MIDFALNERPEGSQLVLATGSLHGVKLTGREINPETKGQLLQSCEYEAVRSFRVKRQTLLRYPWHVQEAIRFDRYKPTAKTTTCERALRKVYQRHAPICRQTVARTSGTFVLAPFDNTLPGPKNYAKGSYLRYGRQPEEGRPTKSLCRPPMANLASKQTEQPCRICYVAFWLWPVVRRWVGTSMGYYMCSPSTCTTVPLKYEHRLSSDFGFRDKFDSSPT
jgi:hypothetical protein